MGEAAEVAAPVIVSYGRESYAQVIGEIRPLLEAHYEEIAYYQDIPLAPDWERYKKADEAGALRIYTARNERRELIGYVIYMAMPHAHYRTSVQAHQDVLFVAKEFRKGRIGSDLLKMSEADLATSGVQVVYQHIKAKNKGLGRFLRLRGYELIDEIYGKRLDRNGH